MHRQRCRASAALHVCCESSREGSFSCRHAALPGTRSGTASARGGTACRQLSGSSSRQKVTCGSPPRRA
eukprot:scaffold109408_cov72-Phaeocystis_antarctica.AAC.12